MTDDFQKTVNLRERAEQERLAARESAEPRKKAVKRKKSMRPARTRAEAIDQVYGEEEAGNKNGNLRQIERPEARSNYEGVYKRAVAVLAVIIVIFAGYFMFFNNNDTPSGEEAVQGELWYSVKLANGESYYGQIVDTGSDPVVIKNVYYNYDQLNQEAGAEPGTGGNLRLVKRGKEAHGPSGTMNIVRAQVVYMEPLKEESKVLKAILDYEK